MKLGQWLFPTVLGLATMYPHATDGTTPAEAAHFRTTPGVATTLD